MQPDDVLDGLEDVLVGEDRLVGRRTGSLLGLLHAGEDLPPLLLLGLLAGLVVLGKLLVEAGEHLGHVGIGGAELLVHLVAAHLGQVVALRVEEEVVEQRLRGLGRRRLARAQLAVDVHQGVVAGLDVVALKGGPDRLGVVEEPEDLLRGQAHGLQEDRDVLLALAVDPDADGVLLVDLELQPGAAAGMTLAA